MKMGDLGVCSLPRENGDVVCRREDRLCSVSTSSDNPDPASIAEENWERAEEATREIIWRIHPTVEAHSKRKEVIEYVQQLIKSSLGFEVFPYGSVPLKTYLPDGDIDLTVISSPPVEDALVSQVHTVLKGEEQSEDASYKVKDVHCIDAEVKLVKCIVQNIVVDISFNQLGGLCTLCFLEQVDPLVAKSHLFKRSIILIKAWCYYESRILGAHHGLISTYALETLVLYIFHLFHSSLNGPLAVLYRFLDYFSKFDWENYCISLNGPVLKSSLPDIAAKLPENVRHELLLGEEFLKKCANMFSVPSRRLETNSRSFPQKHLNIIDPLKQNNNLGRSVNRGNFYRIRSAFKYGARKLGRILLLPRDKLADELNKFFANTLDRHGSNYWTDMRNSALATGARSPDNSLSSSLSSHSDTCSEDNILLKLADRHNNDRDFGMSGSEKPHHTSHFHFSGLFGENGISSGEMLSNCPTDDEMSCTLRAELKENHFVISNSVSSCTNDEGIAPSSLPVSTPADNVSENVTPAFGERDFSGNSQSLKYLDLGGDSDSHFRSIIYCQYCHLFAMSTIMPRPHVLPETQNKNRWDTVCQFLQMKQNFHSQINTKNVLGPQVYRVNPLALFSATFNAEEQEKRQGTGTYIPNMIHRSKHDRLSSGRGRNQASRTQCQLHRHAYGNDLAATAQEMNSAKNGYELSEAEYPCLGNGKPLSLDTYQCYPSVWGSSNINGVSDPSERIDFGTQGTPLPEVIPSDSGTSCTLGFASSPLVMTAQSPEPILANEQERLLLQAYHLKDDEDFPPLSH